MLRAAYLRPLLVVALVLVASSRPAVASDPFTTYVVPARVELQPDEATATRVVIHGAFFNLTSTSGMKYTDPKCGVMYFSCMPGQEAMCQMQWKELQAAISPTPTLCRGFGMTQVVTTAMLRVEGQPLGSPDSWDLGMGIGPGAYVDGKCPVALQLSCPLAGPGDGGAAGSGGVAGSGAAGTSGTAGAIGGGGAGATAGAGGGVAGATAGTSGGAAGAGVAGATAGAPGKGGAGVAGAGNAAGAAGAGGKAETKPGPGCAIAGAQPSAMGSLALLALGALITGIRRRRR